MDKLNERVLEAYKRNILKIQENSNEDLEEKKLDEASAKEYEDMPIHVKKIAEILAGKNQADNQLYFDGIHGYVIHSTNPHGNAHRLDINEIKKLTKDKNIRWIEIKAIGVKR